MILRALLVIAFLTALSPGRAEVTKLGADDRKRIANAPSALFLSMKQLPESIVRACATVTADHEFRLADSSQPYQETDIIDSRKEHLPRRRLIWAASIPSGYVIHYESGGYAHSFHLLLATEGGTPKTARVVWTGVSNNLLPDYDAFLRALKHHQLDDRLDYYH